MFGKLIVAIALIAFCAQMILAAPEAPEPRAKRDFLGLEGVFNNIMDGLSDVVNSVAEPLGSIG